MCEIGGESFGQFFKRKRIERQFTLREFCRKYSLDPGNISKLERGRMSAPRSRATLLNYSIYLGLREEEWELFTDLADVSAGRIPPDLAEREIVARCLPVLFRVVRGATLNEKKLRELVAIIAKS